MITFAAPDYEKDFQFFKNHFFNVILADDDSLRGEDEQAIRETMLCKLAELESVVRDLKKIKRG